jgi:hypothetical protein
MKNYKNLYVVIIVLILGLISRPLKSQFILSLYENKVEN